MPSLPEDLTMPLSGARSDSDKTIPAGKAATPPTGPQIPATIGHYRILCMLSLCSLAYSTSGLPWMISMAK